MIDPMEKPLLRTQTRGRGLFRVVELVVARVPQGFVKKDYVESYTDISSAEDIQKSVASGVFRGAVGGLALGGVGALAGVLLAKNKRNVGKLVAVRFRDGKESLLKLDAKAYESMVKACFCSPKYVPKTESRRPLKKGSGKGLRYTLIGFLALSVCFALGISDNDVDPSASTESAASVSENAASNVPAPTAAPASPAPVTAVADTSAKAVKETKSSAVKTVAQTDEDWKKKVDPSALRPMTPENYPKFYKAWGPVAFEELNRLFVPTAKKAALTANCDRVSYVGVSPTRSRPPVHAVLFAVCANGHKVEYVRDIEP